MAFTELETFGKEGPGQWGPDLAGTIMEVMSGLMGSEMPLAIIPVDPKEACKLICENPSKLRTIDVGRYDRHYPRPMNLLRQDQERTNNEDYTAA